MKREKSQISCEDQLNYFLFFIFAFCFLLFAFSFSFSFLRERGNIRYRMRPFLDYHASSHQWSSHSSNMYQLG